MAKAAYLAGKGRRSRTLHTIPSCELLVGYTPTGFATEPAPNCSRSHMAQWRYTAQGDTTSDGSHPAADDEPRKISASPLAEAAGSIRTPGSGKRSRNCPNHCSKVRWLTCCGGPEAGWCSTQGCLVNRRNELFGPASTTADGRPVDQPARADQPSHLSEQRRGAVLEAQTLRYRPRIPQGIRPWGATFCS